MFDDFIAGGQYADLDFSKDTDFGDTEPGQKTEVLGAQAGVSCNGQVADLMSSPFLITLPPLPTSLTISIMCSSTGTVCSNIMTASGTCREDAPGRYFHAITGTEVDIRSFAHKYLAAHIEIGR